MDVTHTTKPGMFGTMTSVYADETGREVVIGSVPASQHEDAMRVLAALPAGSSIVYRVAKARSVSSRSYWRIQHSASDWAGTVKADRIGDLLDEATRAADLIAEHIERQAVRAAEQAVAEAAATLVTQPTAARATDRQVDYLVSLLLRCASDESGFHAIPAGLIIGTAVDRAAVARLTSAEASMLISSLTGSY